LKHGGDFHKVMETNSGRQALPHDRSAELWVDHKATEKLSASIRRWVTTLMHDEGISNPLARDEATVKAKVWTKQAGTVAGLNAADHLLREWMPGAKWQWSVGDGAKVNAGKVILDIEGGREQVLAAERIILNLIGRLSGIATNTSLWEEKAAPVGVASTRKVHWGLLDKWAVHLGGGLTHRLNRKDATMIKENDLASLIHKEEKRPRGIARVVNELDMESLGAFIVLEVRTIDEAIAAAETWAQRMEKEGRKDRLTVMLDNMDTEKAKEVVLDLEARQFRELVIIEASGGISFDDLPMWSKLGVDVISSSGLHCGTNALDVSMLFDGA
jgi:nicotinate-nucleotide pyrophosphorylase (carboxylating)